MRHIAHRGYHYAFPPSLLVPLLIESSSADTPPLALLHALGFRRCFCVSPLVRAPCPRSVSQCRISCTSLGCRLLLLPLLICLFPIYLLYSGPTRMLSHYVSYCLQYTAAPIFACPRLHGMTFNALSKSAMISAMFSMPTDTWDNRENMSMAKERTIGTRAAHPDEVRRHPRRELLLRTQLLVRRACRVDHQRLRVACPAPSQPPISAPPICPT